MPSPFPGMDPWLEDPAAWEGFHFRFIADVQAQLNPLLLPRYVAVTEERVFLSEAARGGPLVSERVPDLQVRPGAAGSAAAPRGSAVVMASTLMPTVPRRRVRERRVEVRDAASGAVVAVLELLSPTNKRAGSHGRASFLRKKRDVIRSDAHWLEIDLLRGGEPTFRRPPGDAAYAVHLSPADARPVGRVWPVGLRDPLPTVAVPLRAPDPEVPLDLAAVLTATYDTGGYGVRLNYAADPVPPLPPDQAAWADGVLRAARGGT